MTKVIKGDLVMTEDMTFDEDLVVKGNIFGKNGHKYSLKVNGDLNCFNLNCFDLNCLDLNCRDLSYYAVAFAYTSFKCKSVKGRRENSKHFCLDGEVQITEEKKK